MTRSMQRYGMLLGLVLGTGATESLWAQRPLSVSGQQSLSFGVVLPGVARAVSRTDPLNSGQFSVSGVKNSGVQLTFSLPTTMTGPAGATMPLSFGASDGGYSTPETIGIQVAFDPRAAFTTALDKNGKALVYLGGTALPTSSQRAGNYTGTIILTVAYFP